MAVDAKQRVKAAKAERWKGYDDKRKRMVDELERNEREHKKARMEKQQAERKQWQDEERVKTEGKRMREEREKQMRESASAAANAPQPAEDDAPSLGKSSDSYISVSPDFAHAEQNDTTVKLRYSISSHPTLTTSDALSSLFAQFGSVDSEHIALILKKKKASALMPFKRISDAFAAVCSSGRKDLGLEGVEVSWVGGTEPEIVAWLKRNGMLGSVVPPTTTETKNGTDQGFSSFPSTFVSRRYLTLRFLADTCLA